MRLRGHLWRCRPAAGPGQGRGGGGDRADAGRRGMPLLKQSLSAICLCLKFVYVISLCLPDLLRSCGGGAGGQAGGCSGELESAVMGAERGPAAGKAGDPPRATGRSLSPRRTRAREGLFALAQAVDLSQAARRRPGQVLDHTSGTSLRRSTILVEQAGCRRGDTPLAPACRRGDTPPTRRAPPQCYTQQPHLRATPAPGAQVFGCRHTGDAPPTRRAGWSLTCVRKPRVTVSSRAHRPLSYRSDGKQAGGGG